MPEDRRPLPRLFWVIPASALVVGLLLGALLVAVADGGSDTDESGDGASAAPSARPTGDVPADRTVVIPGSCVAAADAAEQSLDLVRRGTTALRELDAADLSDVVDQLQRAEPRLRELSRQCRDAAVTGPTPGSD